MDFRTPAFSLALASLTLSVCGLQVAPGSQCASLCLDQKNGNAFDPNASATGVTDIVCNDADYSSSSVGATFRSCTECLQNSTAVSGAESDVSWYLYNLRFAVDVCVYAFANSSTGGSSPCALDQTCGPLKRALGVGGVVPTNETEYRYCDADQGIFARQGGDCAQCLALNPGQKYLSNFVVALYAGCQQRPAPGTLLGLSGSIFSTSSVNIVVPPANQTAAASTSSATGMTTGAIVGIAVGAGLLLLSAVSLFIVYCRRQKRYEKEDAGLLPPAFKAPGSFDTITSRAIGYYTTDYKAPCPEYEPRDPNPPSEFSSNADYYDRMVDKRRPSDLSADNPPMGDLSAFPAHHAYIPRTMARASRVSSPNLSLRPKTNTPLDSYALQQYLHAAEESLVSTLPPPPNATPPRSAPRSTRGQSPARLVKSQIGSTPNSSARARMGSPPLPASVKPQPVSFPPRPSRSQGSSPQPLQNDSHIEQPRPSSRATNQGLPAPPPRQRDQTPSMILPTVPRIKVPKKGPPKIQVQDATPISEQQAAVDISLPISYPEERFREHRDLHDQDAPRQSRTSPGLSVDSENSEDTPAVVVEQLVEGYMPREYHEVPIASGKSILYG